MPDHFKFRQSVESDARRWYRRETGATPVGGSYCPVAQQIERPALTREVDGANPSGAANFDTSSSVLVGIHIGAYTSGMEKGVSHADYNIIFTSDVVDEMPVERHRLTELYVPSGEIVVTDPLVVPDLLPLKRRIPVGKYPVDLYIAKTPASGFRVAIAVLTFGAGLANRYELALRGEERVSDLKDDRSYFGFPVDAGLGSFYDLQTSRLYNQFIDEFYLKHAGGNIYDDYLAERFKANARHPENPHDAGDWLDFHIPTSPQHNVAMFASGYGDGVYPAYWGIDTIGNAKNLVIDFHVLLLPD